MTKITTLGGSELFNMTSLMRACTVTREKNQKLSINGWVVIDGIEYNLRINAYDIDRTLGIYTLDGVRVGDITICEVSDKEGLSVNFDSNTKAAIVHRHLVREGKFEEARYLLKKLLSRSIKESGIVHVGLHDNNGWAIAKYFTSDFNGYWFSLKGS